MDNSVAQNAVMYTGAGTLVLTMVLWFMKKAVRDVNSTATDHVVQGASRAQVESLREEIGRLEVLVRNQSAQIDQLNAELMKLRLAFIDEQSALLRILAEFSASSDTNVRTRIAQEIEAANRRRLAVVNLDDKE